MSSSLPLIVIAVAAFAANSLCTRYFQLKLSVRRYSIRLYQCLFCLMASIGFCLSNQSFQLPAVSAAVYGILFGIFFCSAVYCSAKCYECGPMSLTAIITNLSMVIPLFYSCLLRGESVSALQAVGFLLMIVTIILSSRSGNGNGNPISKKWFVYVSVSFLSNGATAVIQKYYKATYPDGQSALFMATAYLVAAVLFFLLYIGSRGKNKGNELPEVTSRAKLVALSAASGCGSFFGNGLLMNLSTKVNASILYPSLNGGLCITIALSSFLLFKEKPNRYKVLAICMGLIAIIVLNA